MMGNPGSERTAIATAIITATATATAIASATATLTWLRACAHAVWGVHCVPDGGYINKTDTTKSIKLAETSHENEPWQRRQQRIS